MTVHCKNGVRWPMVGRHDDEWRARAHGKAGKHRDEGTLLIKRFLLHDFRRPGEFEDDIACIGRFGCLVHMVVVR